MSACPGAGIESARASDSVSVADFCIAPSVASRQSRGGIYDSARSSAAEVLRTNRSRRFSLAIGSAHGNRFLPPNPPSLLASNLTKRERAGLLPGLGDIGSYA